MPSLSRQDLMVRGLTLIMRLGHLNVRLVFPLVSGLATLLFLLLGLSAARWGLMLMSASFIFGLASAVGCGLLISALHFLEGYSFPRLAALIRT